MERTEPHERYLFCTMWFFTVDTTPPEINGCPLNTTIDHDASATNIHGGSLVTWREPSVSDMSNTAHLLLRTHDPGSVFYPGNTAVTYIYADASNNIARCTFNVNVVRGEIIEKLLESEFVKLLGFKASSA